jgi:hypothetical protein
LDGAPARGSTINLVGETPDLAANSLTTDYQPSSGSTGTFSITGWPTSFTTSSGSLYAISGSTSYNLTALINKSTGQLLSGSLSIDGTIPSLSASSGTLLTGQVAEWDYGYQNGGGDVFEFIVNVTGGDLAHYYSGQLGIIATASGSGFTGSFLTSFSTDPSQTATDNMAIVSVPEPSSVLLLLGVLSCGLPAWLGFRRRTGVTRR